MVLARMVLILCVLLMLAATTMLPTVNARGMSNKRCQSPITSTTNRPTSTAKITNTSPLVNVNSSLSSILIKSTASTLAVTSKQPTTKSLIQTGQLSLSSLSTTSFSTAKATTNKVPRIYAPATSCNPLSCHLPICRCAGTDIPAGFSKSNTPQMIMLTMDDGVALENIQIYKDLLDGVNSSNGCPIKATFFVSGDNTDYNLVKELQLRGHEIADHSVTHKFPIEWWSQNSYADQKFEIVGQMNTIQDNVGVITRGWRTPFLGGTENTFRVLADNEFLYDSTLGTFPGVRWWPYTLDHLPSTECYMENCPLNSYPGLWEVPLVPWQCDQAGNDFGTMIDECQDSGDEESVYQMIMRNFQLHYQDNKQPFPIFGHSFWFDNASYRKTALVRFINDVRKLSDVYFVTVQQVVQWTQSPIGQDKNPFSCR